MGKDISAKADQKLIEDVTNISNCLCMQLKVGEVYHFMHSYEEDIAENTVFDTTSYSAIKTTKTKKYMC